MNSKYTYALFDFFEENCIEIGEASMICDCDDLGALNENDVVTVTWASGRSSKTSTKTTSKSKKKQGGKYPATVIKFSGNREELVKIRNELTSSGPTPLTTTTDATTSRKSLFNKQQSSDMGRGKRIPVKKRSFTDSEISDEDVPVSVRPKKKQTSISSSTSSHGFSRLVAQLGNNHEEDTCEPDTCCDASVRLHDLRMQVNSKRNKLVSLQDELDLARQEITRLRKEKKSLVHALTLVDGLPCLMKQFEALVKSPTVTPSPVQGSKCPTPTRATHNRNDNSSALIKPDMLLRCNTRDPQKLTNDLLSCLCTDEDLASHSLTGGKSHKQDTNAQTKEALDPRIVDEIMENVREKFPDRRPSDVKGYIRVKLNNSSKQLHRKGLSSTSSQPKE